MSSWLDRAFIDGDKSAAKLDKATLTNKGDISLTFPCSRATKKAPSIRKTR